MYDDVAFISGAGEKLTAVELFKKCFLDVVLSLFILFFLLITMRLFYFNVLSNSAHYPVYGEPALASAGYFIYSDA